MMANELLAETHPGRTILEDVVKPLGLSVNALAKELHILATR
jgi:plasmid maintenance system antidote protein VapI